VVDEKRKLVSYWNLWWSTAQSKHNWKYWTWDHRLKR